MAFPKTLSAAKAANFTVVAAGDATTDAGFILSEDQVNNIEASLSASETAAENLNGQVTQLTADLAAANAAKSTAESNASTLTKSLETVTADRDKFKAEAEEYGDKTGEVKDTKKDKDPDAKTKKAFVSSMDMYAEDHGVSRHKK